VFFFLVGKKKKYVPLIGSFSEESIGEFMELLLRGKARSTISFDEFPRFESEEEKDDDKDEL